MNLLKNKTVVLWMLICVNAMQGYAQDVILLKNGNELNGKIIETTLNEIKYRKSENINGPLISISTESVYSIKYENGIIDTINSALIISGEVNKKNQEIIVDTIKAKRKPKSTNKTEAILYAGISIPTGKYANNKQIPAVTGFTAGGLLVVNITNSFMSIVCDGNYTTHKLHPINSYQKQYFSTNARYDLGSLMLGIRFQTNSNHVKLYASLLSGISYASIDGVYAEPVGGTGFAYCPGLGLVIKKFTVGARFYNTNPKITTGGSDFYAVRALQFCMGFKL